MATICLKSGIGFVAISRSGILFTRSLLISHMGWWSCSWSPPPPWRPIVLRDWGRNFIRPQLVDSFTVHQVFFLYGEWLHMRCLYRTLLCEGRLDGWGGIVRSLSRCYHGNNALGSCGEFGRLQGSWWLLTPAQQFIHFLLLDNFMLDNYD